MKRRMLWIAGAALMGVVVIKLFLVDLSNVGGVERIVSFIGVGMLMLLIGYLSPVPPRTARNCCQSELPLPSSSSRTRPPSYVATGVERSNVLRQRASDFAYAVPIDIDGNGALYQLELPQSVYEGAVHGDSQPSGSLQWWGSACTFCIEATPLARNNIGTTG